MMLSCKTTLQKDRCFPLGLIRFHAVLITAAFCSLTDQVSAQNVTVKAYFNQSAVVENQVARLVVEVSGPDAQSASQPELPDFGDWFRFTGTQGASQNFSMIGNQVSFSKSYTYDLMPLKKGTAVIPPIKVTAGSKQFTSPPVTIEIKDSGAVPQPQGGARSRVYGGEESELVDILFVAAPDKISIYQNEGVTVEYKVYIGSGVSVQEYSPQNIPNTAGFWTEDYPIPQPPRAIPETYLNRQYNAAVLKRVELFPTNSGDFELDPMEVHFLVSIPRERAGGSLFDRFFNDPFFNTSKNVTLQSNRLKLNVKPLPVKGRPASFYGAVGKYSINAEVDNNRVKAHESVTFIVTISGAGNIKLLNETEIQFPDEFEKYEPKIDEKINRTGSEITGEKTFEYVLIPRREGTYVIEPVEFTYFDPVAEAYITDKTAPIRISVEPGDEISARTARSLNREEIKLVGQDIRFIKESVVKWEKIGTNPFAAFSFIALLLTPVLLVGAAFVYSRRLNRLNADLGYKRSLKANAVATKRLKKAHSFLKNNEPELFYLAIADALQEYIADKLNVAAAGLVTEELEKMLLGKQVDEDLVQLYCACLQTCDYHRFASVKSTIEEMEKLYEKSRTAIYSMEERLKKAA